MATPLRFQISDDLQQALEKASDETGLTTARILHKALALYMISRERTKDGRLALALVDAQTEALDTRIVGL